MRWKTVLALLAVLLTIGAAVVITRNPQIPESEAALRKRLEEAEQFPKMMGVITERENVAFAQRAKDDPFTLPMQFKQKEERVFFAVCHPDCGDIKLEILNDKGDVVAERTDPNSVNKNVYSPPEGSYLLKVTLLACPRERCDLGASAWKGMPVR